MQKTKKATMNQKKKHHPAWENRIQVVFRPAFTPIIKRLRKADPITIRSNGRALELLALYAINDESIHAGMRSLIETAIKAA